MNTWVILGGALILVGLLIEALADQQKQAAKYRDSNAFVSDGLYMLVGVIPTMLAKSLWQIGLIVAGVGAVSAGWGNYAAVVIAPFYVILLMISECTRSDKAQLARYGDTDAYKTYVANSGSMLPRF